MSIKHQPSRTPLTLMCPGAVHSPLVSSSTPVPLLSALGSGVLQTMLPTLPSLVIQLPVQFCHLKVWSRDLKAGGTEKFPALVPMAVDAAGNWGLLLLGRWRRAAPAPPEWCLLAREAPGSCRCKFWGPS